MPFCTTDWYVSNRLGVGTDAPEAPINIRCDSSSSSAFLRILTCAGSSGRRVDINAGGGIEYTIPSGTSQSPYIQVEGGVPEFGGGSFRIRTGAAGSGAADRLVVLQNGNINVQGGGILSVYRSDNARALQLYTTVNETVIDSWEASSEPLHIRSMGTGGRIQFFTNGSERLRINCAGNVGVNTSAPSATLHVTRNENQDNIGTIRYENASTSTGSATNAQLLGVSKFGCAQYMVWENFGMRIGMRSISAVNGGCGELYFTTCNDTTQMVIKNSGNVGIGTSSPSSRLDVSGADGRIQSRVDSSDGSTINVRPNAGKCGWISYTEDAVADRWGIGIKNGDAKLYFASGNVGSAGGTTRMVMDGCNFGINTTAPSTKLHVCNPINQAYNPLAFNSDLHALHIQFCNQNQRAGLIRFTSHGNLENTFGVVQVGCAAAGCGQGDFVFQAYREAGGAAYSELMRLTNTGNVGISTSTPSYRLHVNGTFYAAGSSQDYKEGICQYNTDSCLFMCLKPKTYQYKDEWKHLGKDLKSETQIGLIAEEVAESHPELAILVNEEDNKVVRNVDYEKLSIVLLAEVQKLRQEVDQLKNK